MMGDIMNYTHKDIYYLEMNTKSQTSEDLINLFASPAGRELVKYKPKTKTKYKSNPVAINLFEIKTTISTTAEKESANRNETTPVVHTEITTNQQSKPTATTLNSKPEPEDRVQKTRRKSLDLYNEAASILGLTCSQTNDCKCIECQCHYFDDYDDEMDYTNGDKYTDHQSLCTIQ